MLHVFNFQNCRRSENFPSDYNKFGYLINSNQNFTIFEYSNLFKDVMI